MNKKNTIKTLTEYLLLEVFLLQSIIQLDQSINGIKRFAVCVSLNFQTILFDLGFNLKTIIKF